MNTAIEAALVAPTQPMQPTKMSIEDFFEIYKPIPNPNCIAFDEDYIWKTSPFEVGNAIDMKVVNDMMAEDHRRVWTIHHTDSLGLPYVVNGMHVVNREGFIITQVPYEGDLHLTVSDSYSAIVAKYVINVKSGIKNEADEEAFEYSIQEALEALADKDTDGELGMMLEVDEVAWIRKSGCLFATITVMVVYDGDCEEDVDFDSVRQKLHTVTKDHPQISTYALEMKDKLIQIM